MFDHSHFLVRMVAGGVITFLAGILLFAVLRILVPIPLAVAAAILLAWVAGRKAVPRHRQPRPQ